MTETANSLRQTQCLDEVLSTGSLNPARAQRLARQIADELCVAHKYGVIHGDLSPACVSLIGSDKAERAILTGFGDRGNTSPDTDIYNFGRLLEAMMPGNKLAETCMAPNRSDRPDSFEMVIEELQEFSACRTWIGSLLIGAAAASLLFYELALNHSNT